MLMYVCMVGQYMTHLTPHDSIYTNSIPPLRTTVLVDTGMYVPKPAD